MKIKYLLIIVLCFCISCSSKVFTITPLNKDITANIGENVMQWEILKRGRTTKQRLVYNGSQQGFVNFLLYTYKPNARMRSGTLRYDLNVSKIIHYKGAEIEVIDATPKKIRYFIRVPFKGRQDSFSR